MSQLDYQDLSKRAVTAQRKFSMAFLLMLVVPTLLLILFLAAGYERSKEPREQVADILSKLEGLDLPEMAPADRVAKLADTYRALEEAASEVPGQTAEERINDATRSLHEMSGLLVEFSPESGPWAPRLVQLRTDLQHFDHELINAGVSGSDLATRLAAANTLLRGGDNVRIAELQKEIAELGVTLQMHGAREYGHGDTVPIYFGLGNATSTFESEKTLSMIGNSARRGVKLVHVVGHADTVGTYESNMDLSEARAQLIANRLGKLGFEVSSIGWRGEQELLEITHDEVDEPRNRRVDVVLE